tara:strand:+ start:2039 stop:2215 length:177 start_codon:yes stop_codon:yes gene_type:complete
MIYLQFHIIKDSFDQSRRVYDNFIVFLILNLKEMINFSNMSAFLAIFHDYSFIVKNLA